MNASQIDCIAIVTRSYPIYPLLMDSILENGPEIFLQCKNDGLKMQCGQMYHLFLINGSKKLLSLKIF